MFGPGWVVNRVQGLVEDRLPHWAHFYHRRKWDRKWSRPDYKPFWRTDAPQKELVEAIASGWFRKDDCILDIGCGGGEVSRWLAGNGFATLGIDYSLTAVNICRQLSGEMNLKLRFEIVDICGEVGQFEPMASVVDRGCFHRIPKRFQPIYVRSLARLTSAGAHFLLIAATYQRRGFTHHRDVRSVERLHREMEQLFGDYFSIERAESTMINADEGREPMPAAAFWMMRNQTFCESKVALSRNVRGEPRNFGQVDDHHRVGDLRQPTF